jgi:hypothetical protein
MTTRKSVAKQVQSVIVNANMSQSQRDDAWESIGSTIQTKGETFAAMVRKLVSTSGMTMFTKADSDGYKARMLKNASNLGYSTERKILKSGEKQTRSDAEKFAANRLTKLLYELRQSEVAIEVTKAANNKKGANGKTPAATKEVGKGLGKWNEAMALILQHVPELTMELDRLALTKLLAKLETQHKAQVTR